MTSTIWGAEPHTRVLGSNWFSAGKLSSTWYLRAADIWPHGKILTQGRAAQNRDRSALSGGDTPCSRCDKSQKLRRDKAWSFWRGENAPNDWTGKGQRVLGMGGTLAVTCLAHSLQILAGGLSVNLASPCHSVIEGKFRQGLLLSLDFWRVKQTFPVLCFFLREAFAKDHLFLENDFKRQHFTCQNLN